MNTNRKFYFRCSIAPFWGTILDAVITHKYLVKDIHHATHLAQQVSRI